jgi:uncharacterized caspase-like protein
MISGPRPVPDHFLSIYQSAIADLARRYPPPAAAEKFDGQGRAKAIRIGLDAAAADLCSLRLTGKTEDGRKSMAGTVRAAALLALRYLEAKAKGDTVQADALRSQFKFAEFDPAWVVTLDEYFRYFGANGSRGTIPYRRPADVCPSVIEIKPDARIAIVGDWGTGEAPAERVAQQIKLKRPDVLIHLGDIYYSGTQAECRAHFLDIVNEVFDRQNTRLPIYTLSGNHDMYSGGAGYYWLLDQLNEGAMRQQASYFCLRSADRAWQFLGLDTGLNDYSPLAVLDAVTFLEPDEEEWHLERIAEFPGRTILLSHHQPFSACAQIGAEKEDGRRCPYNPRLMASFDKFAKAAQTAGGEIAAWYWGHEHIFSWYDTYQGVKRGRCLGNGSIPVFTSDQPFEQVQRLESPIPVMRGPRLASDGSVYALGFGMVTLSGHGGASAEYFQDVNGRGERLAGEPLSELPVESVPDVEFPRSTAVTFVPDDARKGGKLAFILGNGAYSVDALTKSAADAMAVRERLRSLGYKVYGGIDFTQGDLKARFDAFEAVCEGADVAMLYYSGHGIQIAGQNYLVPIDASLASLQEAGPELRMQSLVGRMASQAKKSLVFLDACRDNPFASATEPAGQHAKRVAAPATSPPAVDLASRGLTALEVTPEAETFIAFAAEPGRFAYEGDGDNSRFTTAFLRHFATEGLDLEGLVRRIGADVKRATEGKQRPWSQSNLTQDFFFKPASWQPLYVMAVLGLLAGLVTSYFAFNHTTARFAENYLAGIPFACVLAFGVWRWGSRSIAAALFAAIAASLAWAGGIAVLSHIGTFTQPSSSCEELKFENWKLMRDLIGAAGAGALFIAGCLLGGALTMPSLRRTRVITMALLSGVAVVLVHTLVLKLGLLTSGTDCRVITPHDVGVNFLGGALWQFFLGAAIGYGICGYVPKYLPLPGHQNPSA